MVSPPSRSPYIVITDYGKLNVRQYFSSIRTGMSDFKQVVIDFLVTKLPVIYHLLLSSYLALSKYIGKNNTTHNVCCIRIIH
jgi:hypothetical protein